MKAFVALLALAGGLAACARDARDHGGGPVIRFVGWGAPEERGVMTDAIAAFAGAHPGVRVEYTQVPGIGYDYLNKLRLMIVAGMAPDVFYVPDAAFGELVRTGALLDVDDRAHRALDLSAMWRSGLDRYRWDGTHLHEGRLHALPKDIGPTAMFYDVERFREAGVPLPDPVLPLTWDEAIATWRALGGDRAGIRRYGVTGFPLETAVWSSGDAVLSPDARSWVMTSPEAVRATQWCADLALVEHVAPNPTRIGAEGAGGRELFEARIAATHIDGRWMVPRFRKLGFEWDVAPIPVPDRSHAGVVWSGSVGLAVSAKTTHPDEAFALVAYLAGPEGQTRLTRTGLQLPNQRDLAMTDLFLQPGQRPAHADVFVRAADTSRPSEATRTANAFWFDVFTSFLDEVWRGQRTAAEVFPELKPRIDTALRTHNEEP